MGKHLGPKAKLHRPLLLVRPEGAPTALLDFVNTKRHLLQTSTYHTGSSGSKMPQFKDDRFDPSKAPCPKLWCHMYV
jgi:hypothetical protein